MSEQKVNIELTSAEASLLLHFLGDLSDKYGNAGCNDIELDNTDENWQMVNNAYESNGDDDAGERDSGPRILTQDFILCDYLATAIEKQLPATPPQFEEEG